MAHLYAGILGPIAFLTTIARGAIHGGEPITILFSAWLSLLVFAPLGYAIGGVAGRLVEEAVKGRIETELQADSKDKESTAKISRETTAATA